MLKSTLLQLLILKPNIYISHKSQRVYRLIFQSIKKEFPQLCCICMLQEIITSFATTFSQIVVTDHFLPFVREDARVYVRVCVASINPRRLLAHRPPRRGMRICLREYHRVSVAVRPLVEGRSRMVYDRQRLRLPIQNATMYRCRCRFSIIPTSSLHSLVPQLQRRAGRAPISRVIIYDVQGLLFALKNRFSSMLALSLRPS